MNPFEAFAEDFQLIKPTGERVPSRGIWGDKYVTVHDAKFSGEAGDAVERTWSNGTVERRDVEGVRFEKGKFGMPDAYHLDLVEETSGPRLGPVVHNTTYNITGSAGAVGPGATAHGNTIISSLPKLDRK